MSKKRKKSVQEMFGLESFSEYGIRMKHQGEFVFFRVEPYNVNIISPQVMLQKILMFAELLSSISQVAVTCIDAAENFEENRSYLLGRIQQEQVPWVKTLLEQDADWLDGIQSEIVTTRHFIFSVYIRNGEIHPGKIEKMLHDYGFSAKRMDKREIKRMLAIYFSCGSGELPDIAGEQYITEITEDLKSRREEELDEKDFNAAEKGTV